MVRGTELAHLLRGDHHTRVIASHLEGDGHFTSERFTVGPVLCRDEDDYWRGLAKHWGSGLTLVNLEHDIDATDEHIAELLACPHPACTWAYECHWATTGQSDPQVAAGKGDFETHLTGGEEWADWSAIGLVKLRPEARIAGLARTKWQLLEHSVHASVRGPWHVHWPLVAHHHW